MEAVLRSRRPGVLGPVMICATSFRTADVHVVTLLTMLSALIYLTAAATARRRAAWVALFGTREPNGRGLRCQP